MSINPKLLSRLTIVPPASAALVGLVSIQVMRRLVRRARLSWFAYYCWFAGVVTLILTFVHKG